MASNPSLSLELSNFLEKNGDQGRTMLLPALLLTQKIHEYVPPESAAAIGTALTLFSYSLSGSSLGLQKTKTIGFLRNSIGALGVMLTITLLFSGFGWFLIFTTDKFMLGILSTEVEVGLYSGA